MNPMRLSDLIDQGLGLLVSELFKIWGDRYHEEDDYELIAQIKKERDEALAKGDGAALTLLVNELCDRVRFLRKKRAETIAQRSQDLFGR